MKKRILSTVLTLSMCLSMMPPVAAVGADSKALVEGTAVYDEVLGTYETQHQDSIRYEDGATKVTGQEWLKDSETVGVNRERAHAQFVPYQSADAGLAAEKSVLDDVKCDTSSYYKLLSGKDWDFALLRNPAEAAKKDAAYLAETYTGKDFTPEYVPQSWQTYRNADGTFKYFDEPMYTNHPFPWIGNFEPTNYNDPSAPTEYNPVGYYRTTFTTPADWQERETFISLQSVESAYYLYVNGKCVGYSTDAFTAHDFNLTPYLKPAGETNTLAIKIFRWSIGSWLENQDFIRESGIYRDVYLYSKGEAEIRDFFVKTKFKDRTSVSSDVDVTVETDVRGLRNAAAGDYKVSAHLVDAAGATVATAADQTVNIAAAAAKTPAQKLADKGSTVTTAFTVTNPDKWFADTPNLYRLVLELKKGDAVVETAVQRIGFREIYKTILNPTSNNEQIQITGQQIIFRGTNRHDTDLETGHALNLEDYTADLKLMKQSNINAIRTSHYPNDKAMYDLADELGLYICAEANIESHRAAMNGINVPTGPTDGNGLSEWVPPVLDRIATNTERYKNHASVVIWSLGNEATYSKPKLTNEYSFWVGSMYLLARDPSRIRKYEREGVRGYTRPAGTDPWSTDARKNVMIDVISTQYATPGYRNSNQFPFLHSEYNHAMGQAYGNAMEHWETIRKYDNIQGGFIWDWVDQSRLTTKDSNGDGVAETFWGYGGDWIDPIANDNAFCGNGLAYADRSAGPMTLEARKVHQQVSFYNQSESATPGGNVSVQVVNEFENTPLSAFDITWTLLEDGKQVPNGTGKLELSTPAVHGLKLTNTEAGGNAQTIEITLPSFTAKEGSDYLLDFSVKYKTEKPWAAAGSEVAYEQFQLTVENRTPATAGAAAPDFATKTVAGDILTLTGTTDAGKAFSIKLNTAMGQLVEYALDGKTVMTAGPELSLWHPQTYNEASYSAWTRPLQDAGNPLNQTNLMVSVDKSAANKVTMTTSGTLKVDADSAMTLEIQGNGEIIVYEQFVPKSNFETSGLPKVGTRMVVDGAYGNFNWYGRGPWETYSDRKSGARINTYESTVDEQYDMKMLKPQENGNHTDVRWTSLTDDAGTGLLVSAGNDKVVEVSALHNTAEEINSSTYNSADYRHPVDIKQRKDIVWSIDLRQDGVGDTGFSSAYPIAKYKIPTDKTYSYSYRISPIAENSDAMAKSKEPFVAPVAEYQVSSILVNGTAIAGFSPISRDFTYELPVNASSAVVTAVSSGDVSITTNQTSGTVTVTSIDSSDRVETYTIHMVRAKKQMMSTSVFAKAIVNNFSGSGNSAAKLIDGNLQTFWDYDWTGDKTSDLAQLYYAVELITPTRISSVGYIPRHDAQTNGSFQGHDIYVSTLPIDELNLGAGKEPPTLTDTAKWTKVSSGTWDVTKTWKDDVFPLTEAAVKTILVQPTSAANSPAPPSSAYGCGAETRFSAPRDASAATVAMDASYALVGNKAEPDPSITVDGTKLIRGVDYTVAYTNNTAAGEATATITYKGQFYGADVVKNFTVTALNDQELVLGISLNGTPLAGYAYETDHYTYEMPFATTDMVVTANVADGVACTVKMENDGAKVVATKGDVTKTYTIAMTRAAAPASMGGAETFAKASAHDTHSASSTSKMYDKNSGTYWENSWTPQTVKEAYVALELKTPTPLSQLQYLPRQEANQKNGRFLQYEVYVSTKPLSEVIVSDYPTDLAAGGDWVKVSEGTWASDIAWKSATLTGDFATVKSVLIQPKTTDSKDGHPNAFGCVAEITVTPSTDANKATVTIDATSPLVNNAATPDPVIMMGGTKLVRGVDYTVAYTNNTAVGTTATATITYKGAYSGTDVTKNFTVGAAANVLTAPTTLAWDTTVPGKATWAAVEHATGYSVQLYKDGMPLGNALTVAATEKNFTGVILDSGSYTFKVKALGNGTTYADSPLSSPSAAYAYGASYIVRLAPGMGYTLQAKEGSSNPVDDGGSFSFTLTVDDSHSTAVPMVKVNNVELASTGKEGNVYSYTISDIREHKSVTVAGLSKNTYVITFKNGEDTVAEKKVPYGGNLTLNQFPAVPAKVGYTGEWAQKTAISNVTANATVAAVYTPNTYVVTFNANGGSVTPETLTVTFDAAYGELPVPTGDVSVLFDGWFTAADETGARVNAEALVTLSEDHTLYAHWRDVGTSEAPEAVVSGMPEKVTLPYTGEGIALTVANEATYTYQWKRATSGGTWRALDGVTTGDEWQPLDGATTATYTIPAEDIIHANSGWKYLCTVTNTQGDKTPSTASSVPVTLTVEKGFQSAPEELISVPTTAADTADGAIKGLDSAKLYEYKGAEDAYVSVAANSESITGLAAGDYSVRFVGTDDYNPSEDTVVTVPEYSITQVTGVTLDATKLDLYSGGTTHQLTAKVAPAEAADTRVLWKSSNTAAATVDETGLVTTHANGKAVITVTTVDGGFTAECVVNVTTYESDDSSDWDSSSNITSTTEKNKDGSTTKTETNKTTGMVTETTTHPDGTKIVATTPKNGKTSLEVTVPQNKGDVTVIIPTGKPLAPGEVAVIVHADGTREVVKTSVRTADGLRVTLDANAKLEIVDNSKSFTDVPADHWGADAIAFVTSREIFNGTGNDNFGPGDDTSRAMLFTVLARLDGQDLAEGETWYESAMNWSKTSGISDGTNPEDSITRESLAVMLYRYAKADKSTAELEGFSDAGNVSEWAADAMRWATEKGIITGKGGALDPQGNATRVEVATMLQRFLSL